MVRTVYRQPSSSSPVILSPHSRSHSHSLTTHRTHYAQLRAGRTIISTTSIIVLKVLPERLSRIVTSLVFQPSRAIIDFVTNDPPSRVTPLITPTRHIYRTVPLPTVTIRHNPLILYPNMPRIISLFTNLKSVIILRSRSHVQMLDYTSTVVSACCRTRGTIVT